MEIVIESSKAVKPADNSGGHVWAADVVLLTAFDELQHDEYMSSIHAFHPPAPSNTILEAGLATALAEHREWAGRLGVDHSTGRRAMFLNDAGARFVEAKAEFPLATIMPLLPGTPVVQRLHPSCDNNGAEELMLVQVTRFSCGSFVVGHAMHHSVGDGIAMVHCLLAWGQATRGIAIEPVPVHDRNSFFIPRNPLRIEFQHWGTEFRAQDERNNMLCSGDDDARNDDEVVTHKVSFSKEFISDLKSRVCEGMPRPYTMVQCLAAHLWRCVTKARGLPSGVATSLHIAVNGRARMRQPQVPQGYTGNVLLWAHPSATARELLAGALGHVSELIRREVARIEDAYFRSFIDFVSSGAVKQEGLVSMADTAECQDCAVYCIQRIPFYELDFGGGQQFLYMPNYHPVDGLIYILPSSPLGDGSVEAQVSLPSHVMDAFKDCCYTLAVPYIQSNI
ncbi:hypothetical protein HU200_061425 [Digitaria exilis]|uniref:Uncharacterized protein n=1 Tax=Digitaria exilis TaxID=1010633 RepID=A0A835A7I4_9POAL|nr:hypothetical protein HU200_061425 [Digitaria exilis]